MRQMRSWGPQLSFSFAHPPLFVRLALACAALLVLLAGCNLPDGQPPVANTLTAATPSQGAVVEPSSMVSRPTATTEPLAASVNGEGISLAEFQAEFSRYQASSAASGQPLPAETDQKQAVLQELIDQVLLAQAATKAGYLMDDTALDQRIADLAAQAGGVSALAEWKTRNGFDDAGFRAALRRAAAASWQRDQVTAQVPTTAEQVHARQILVNSQAEAQAVLDKLKSGADFATLALQYDTLTGGELGWFPRGYLLSPEVEEAAFALQPGGYSGIIESKAGFHVVQVIERDPQYALSPDALQIYQKQTLTRWIEEQRAQSKIELFIR